MYIICSLYIHLCFLILNPGNERGSGAECPSLDFARPADRCGVAQIALLRSLIHIYIMWCMYYRAYTYICIYIYIAFVMYI